MGLLTYAKLTISKEHGYALRIPNPHIVPWSIAPGICQMTVICIRRRPQSLRDSEAITCQVCKDASYETSGATSTDSS